MNIIHDILNISFEFGVRTQVINLFLMTTSCLLHLKNI